MVDRELTVRDMTCMSPAACNVIAAASTDAIADFIPFRIVTVDPGIVLTRTRYIRSKRMVIY